MLKLALAYFLAPLTKAADYVGRRGMALWSYARLRTTLPSGLHPSNVVLGTVCVEGTKQVRIGQHARIYPGVLLETQGEGSIDIGDHVVMSRGVHIVAFNKVTIGDHCMLGEYASVRDANHRKSAESMRNSGHVSAPVCLERNVWVGRGACVLAGVHIGANSIVGANAVLTRSIPLSTVATGVPARAYPIHAFS